MKHEGEQLALYASVKERLRSLSHDSLMGLAINIGMQKNDPVGVLKMIKSQAGDNHNGVENVVGEKLLSDILKLEI